MKIRFVSSNQRGYEEPICQRATAVAVADLQKLRVDAKNIYVAHDADNQTTDELSLMVKAANADKPDLVIAIHDDSAAGNERAVVWPLVPYEGRRDEAEAIGKVIARELGFSLRRAAIRTDLMVLNKTNAPAILFEIGDFGTPEGLAWLNAHKDDIGHAVARGLIERYKLEAKTVAGVADEKDEHASASGFFKGDPKSGFSWDAYLTRTQADLLLARAKADYEAKIAVLTRGMAAVVERLDRLESL